MAKVTNKGGLAAFDKAIKELNKLQSNIGWFASSKYPDGTPVAYVASIQELGYPAGGIPARAPMRLTIAEKGAGWAVLLGKGAKLVLKGDKSARQVYTAFGLQVAGDIRATIAAGKFEPIKESTAKARAKRRGVSVDQVNRDPLRDTNVMVNTLINQTTERTQ